MDMNFIFSSSTRYLTSERSKGVRYRVDHSKIKFVSTNGHVISSISFQGRCFTVLERSCDIPVDNKKFPLSDYLVIFFVEVFAMQIN